MRLLIAASIVLPLLGCYGAPQAKPAETGITLRYSAADLGEATRDANEACAAYGKTAKLRGVDKEDGADVALFDCG